MVGLPVLMNADEVSCRIRAHQLAPAAYAAFTPPLWVPRSRLFGRDLAIGGSMTGSSAVVKRGPNRNLLFPNDFRWDRT